MDVVCPWCYLGKRRLEMALDQMPRRDAFEVVWRAFELDPEAPREREPSKSYAELLASKYGRTLPQAQAMIANTAALAHNEGLDYRFELIRPGNSFDAHRLIRLGREEGRQDKVLERFFRAYFTEGQPIGERETLARHAREAGLNGQAVDDVLAGDRFAREVHADENEARALGVNGVPFFLLGKRYGVSGAQPPEVLREALERAWGEVGETVPVG